MVQIFLEVGVAIAVRIVTGSGRERAEAFDLPGVGHALVVAIAGHLRHRGEGGPTAYVGGIVNETAATTGGILSPAKGARKGRGGGPASIGWSAPGLDEQVKECTPRTATKRAQDRLGESLCIPTISSFSGAHAMRKATRTASASSRIVRSLSIDPRQGLRVKELVKAPRRRFLPLPGCFFGRIR
jgi:hypothetical protein